MRLTIFSRSLMLIGLFSQAFFKPFKILRRLKGSLLPSFFTTNGRASSALSLVVNRLWQPRHSLLRRMVSFSFPSRESTTLLSGWLQKGHFIGLRRLFQVSGCKFQAFFQVLTFHLNLAPLELNRYLLRLNFSMLVPDPLSISLARSSAYPSS